jgi:hypothetical protein
VSDVLIYGWTLPNIYTNGRTDAVCSACCLLHAGFLLGLLRDPEGGGDVPPKRRISPDYTTLYPRRWNFYVKTVTLQDLKTHLRTKVLFLSALKSKQITSETVVTFHSRVLPTSYWVYNTYCDGLLKALRYGTRRTRVTRPTVELRLLSSEGLNNHDNRGTVEDIDS